ncbi:uncharacterized protein LOC124161144 [Ischnura elegans]|uniref:uncharacterized protein LOC124161144 n=1 Tax=Ischnura elegans TaxID=197161 RepID=UPI001ED89406|nr:uncharacterized protein LOC124161144 [Ischnura elegans]
MKVLAVVLLAVCAASAATVEHVVKVPHTYVQPTPYVATPYVAPYHHGVVAPVLTKVEGKPVVTTYTAGAYPVPVGPYAYPYVHSPVAYAAYPYGAPVHTVPVVPKVEKVE